MPARGRKQADAACSSADVRPRLVTGGAKMDGSSLPFLHRVRLGYRLRIGIREPCMVRAGRIACRGTGMVWWQPLDAWLCIYSW